MPNQALQRTGSGAGFTLLSKFQARRPFGRPLNTSSLGAMRLYFGSCVVLLAGVLVGTAFADPEPSAAAAHSKVEHHWQIVHDYRALIRNPDSYEPVPGSDLVVLTPPDISPSLAFLVSAGEIEHADLVFPNVLRTRAATSLWVEWTDGRDDIWEMVGEVNSGERFGIEGEELLHLNIWYDESAFEDIKQLVQDLQALPDAGT